MVEEIYVIGHKNPDLDSIGSAIAYAKLKELLGEEGKFIPARAGELDEESKYILKKFGIETPILLESAKGKKIILVDHATYLQAVDGIREAEIVEVIDHHNIGDLQTDKPIRYHAEPVGSTSTIVASYYFRHNIEIPKKIASLLLAAIISDTDLFKSPTTTKLDKEMKERLEKITGLDAQELGIEMFEVKSNIKNKTVREILTDDAKEYELPHGMKMYVSQIKLMKLDEFIKDKRDEILKEMESIKSEKGVDLFIFIATDLIKEGSELFVIGRTDIFEKGMGVKLENNSVYIDGLMSRKKQVIPKILGITE